MRNFQIACVSSERIINIPDVHVIPVSQSIVEYRTGAGGMLNIDFANPNLDLYIQGAFAFAVKYAPMPAELDQAVLSEREQHFVYLLSVYVGREPRPNAAMDALWTQAWANPPCELGNLMQTVKAAKCRERAVMLHILLAQAGVPSRVVHGSGHAWVICVDSQGIPVLGLDPARRQIFRKAAGEDPLQTLDLQLYEYFEVVKPVTQKKFLSFPNFDWTTPVPANWLK